MEMPRLTVIINNLAVAGHGGKVLCKGADTRYGVNAFKGFPSVNLKGGGPGLEAVYKENFFFGHCSFCSYRKGYKLHFFGRVKDVFKLTFALDYLNFIVFVFDIGADFFSAVCFIPYAQVKIVQKNTSGKICNNLF